MQVLGAEEIIAKLQHLDGKGQRRIARAMVSGGQTVVRKAIRAAVPPQHKSIRKTIASRFKRKKRNNLMEAKTGFGVGKQSQQSTKDRSGRPGVGISKNNIHWWVLGTGERYSKKDGHYSGRMPKGPEVIRQAYAACENAAYQKMLEIGRKKLEEEAGKTS